MYLGSKLKHVSQSKDHRILFLLGTEYNSVWHLRNDDTRQGLDHARVRLFLESRKLYLNQEN